VADKCVLGSIVFFPKDGVRLSFRNAPLSFPSLFSSPFLLLLSNAIFRFDPPPRFKEKLPALATTLDAGRGPAHEINVPIISLLFLFRNPRFFFFLSLQFKSRRRGNKKHLIMWASTEVCSFTSSPLFCHSSPSYTLFFDLRVFFLSFSAAPKTPSQSLETVRPN